MPADIVAIEDYDRVPTYDEITPTPAQVAEMRERYPDDSDKRIEWRVRMSVMAKVRHRLERNEDGSPKFGGAQKGSGRPARRLGEAFKDLADQERVKILDSLMAGLDKSLSPEKRHKHAVNIVKLRHAEDKIEMKERAFEGLNRDDLTTAFVTSVSKRIKSGDPQIKAMLQGALAALSSDSPASDDEDVIDVKAVQS